MEATRRSFDGSNSLANVLGVLAVLMVAVVVMGSRLPLIADDRAAVLALAVIGSMMCGPGIGRASTSLGWLHPITLTGIVLGIAALTVIGLVLTGNASLLGPLVLPSGSPERAAFVLLAGIMLVKWVVGWGLGALAPQRGHRPV